MSVCRQFRNFVYCLSPVPCGKLPAYPRLYRGLEYLLKVRYIILVVLKVTELLMFKFVFSGRSAKMSYVWKVRHKNEWHLRLVAHIFSKVSQNICLINTHILIYWHARCQYKLWKALWFYCFFWVLSYIFDDHSCLNCCISNKLSLIVYPIFTDMSKWQIWLEAMKHSLI